MVGGGRRGGFPQLTPVGGLIWKNSVYHIVGRKPEGEKMKELENLVKEFYQSISDDSADRVGSYRMPTLYNFALWLSEQGYLRPTSRAVDPPAALVVSGNSDNSAGN